MNYNDTILIDGMKRLGLIPTDRQLEQLHTYYEMMVEKNKVMNLTGITEYSEVVLKHFLDSLCIAQVEQQVNFASRLSKGEELSVIDVGTGAGFPGIPLKIMFPQIHITLLDSLNKRILFLQDVVDALKLGNVSCIHGRAEEFSRKEEYRQKYDFAVSRAVARLASLAELCVPFVKKGGYFLPYKTQDSLEEIDEAKYAFRQLSSELISVKEYEIPYSDYRRTIPIISVKETISTKYPRGGGKPLKQPLLP